MPVLALFLVATASSYGATEDQATAKLTKLLAIITRDDTLPGHPVVKVSLQARNVTDDDLEALEDLPQLRELYLGYGTHTTDKGLAHVQHLKHLELLYLPETQITDAGLKYLKDLTDLQKLNLGSPGVTDEGLPELQGLKKLKLLNVSGSRVTEAGAAALMHAIPGLYITGAAALPKGGSPADRKAVLRKHLPAGVTEEMLDFMSYLDATDQGVRSGVKKYGGPGLDSSAMDGINLEQPAITKVEKRGGDICYTLLTKSGIAHRTYQVCWRSGKIISINQLSLQL